MNHKPKGRINLRETRKGLSNLPTVENNMRQKNATFLPISAPVPHRSGRIASQPDRYMFSGESFHAVSIKFEYDPALYEEAMDDVDLAHWVKVMNAELESIDSNQVWDIVEAPANIKPIGYKWVDRKSTRLNSSH